MNVIALPRQIEIRRLWMPFSSFLQNIGLIAAGSIIFTIGMNSILIPHGFLSGGLVGVSMLVHYLFSDVNIGIIYFVLNIPLMILGWRNISRRFMLYSLFGMTFFSVVAAVVYPPTPDIEDPMLAAIFAGVICGTGAGLILRSIGSGGGLDILAICLNKKFGLRIGSIIFISNTLVLLAGAYFYAIEQILYSIVYLFCSSMITDAILTGFNRRKSLLIISDEAESIAHAILTDKGRGVTFLKGEGAFSKKEKNVIFTITSLTELPKMKELVLNLDPNAFMVINDTLEVLGRRHGRGRIY